MSYVVVVVGSVEFISIATQWQSILVTTVAAHNKIPSKCCPAFALLSCSGIHRCVSQLDLLS